MEYTLRPLSSTSPVWSIKIFAVVTFVVPIPIFSLLPIVIAKASALSSIPVDLKVVAVPENAGLVKVLFVRVCGPVRDTNPTS